MNKISKEKKQQIIAILIGSVVLVGCLWYFVIGGQRETIMGRTREVEETEKKIDAAQKLKSKKEKAESDLADATKKLDAIEEGMASGDLYSWVILTMNKFRSGPPPHRVDIRNFSREEIVKVGIFPDFPYQGAKYVMTGTAYYHDLGKFIADFENTFPYFHIRNVDMGPTEGGSSEDAEKLGFRMEIIALVKPVPVAAGAPATK